MFEIKKEYWNNRAIRNEIPYKDGKKHGTDIRWYISGIPRYTASYCYGKKHGPVMWWSPTGKLLGMKYYIHGNDATEEEYNKHKLIVVLSNISKGSL